jgi:hypothetical protein
MPVGTKRIPLSKLEGQMNSHPLCNCIQPTLRSLNGMKGVRTAASRIGAVRLIQVPPKVGTRWEHIAHMNPSHRIAQKLRAHVTNTYRWRAKTPPESSVKMCPLVALRRDMLTLPLNGHHPMNSGRCPSKPRSKHGGPTEPCKHG